MKFSTKDRYALLLMVELASATPGEYLPLKAVSDNQGISVKYLEQIVPMLNKSDILLASRGFQGGYRLAQSPDKYTVGMILRITEGSLAPVACLDHDPVLCDRSADCITLPVWQGLSRAINEYLDSITLQDILDQQQAAFVNDYSI